MKNIYHKVFAYLKKFIKIYKHNNPYLIFNIYY
jgi:hypothetical protein